jgi:hypothetical protein
LATVYVHMLAYKSTFKCTCVRVCACVYALRVCGERGYALVNFFFHYFEFDTRTHTNTHTHTHTHTHLRNSIIFVAAQPSRYTARINIESRYATHTYIHISYVISRSVCERVCVSVRVCVCVCLCAAHWTQCCLFLFPFFFLSSACSVSR